MESPPLIPNPIVDSAGNPVAIGMHTKIMTIPLWLTQDLPAEDAAMLEALRGQVMPIVDIDAFGYVWFASDNGSPWFCVKPTDVLVLADMDTKQSQ
jgi:hypothetical protein